jgi:hypothetical protein
MATHAIVLIYFLNDQFLWWCKKLYFWRTKQNLLATYVVFYKLSNDETDEGNRKTLFLEIGQSLMKNQRIGTN